MTTAERIKNLESWVGSFPGMAPDAGPVYEKFQPLYSSISTTALNGGRLLLLGINPGMPNDHAAGLADWVQHLPAYRAGIFGKDSHYHSYLDYHPNGKVVQGFENMLRPAVESRIPVDIIDQSEWLRSIPVTNFFLRATNREKNLRSIQEETNSLPCVRLLHPALLVWMGSSDARMEWLKEQGIVTGLRRHLLPFLELRGRRVIVRTARTIWGGILLAVPHPNAISGNAMQRQIGAWLDANWEKLIG